jgi:AraC-like DNA-binding protein
MNQMSVSEDLRAAVRAYAREHGNRDGLAIPPVPGLRMICVDHTTGRIESVYRPLVCLILQGSKQLLVGDQEWTCTEGQSIIVGGDMPVTGQIIAASRERPYIAMAIELQFALLAELADQVRTGAARTGGAGDTVFVQQTDQAVVDTAGRLFRLIGHPDALAVLLPGLMKELHFWLLCGPHSAQLRAMCSPESARARLNRAIAMLRSKFRTKIRTDELAGAASMSLTAFHKHFKEFTSLTPGQYQKRLRLIEARRLMLYEGVNANSAAYEVGYESVSQFTREYARMFGAPPRRHSRHADASTVWTDANAAP